MLLSRFTEYIKEHDLFHHGDQLLIAVSGGVDSVVLCELCFRAGFKFSIAHCNFQLRGAESERDQEFVRELSTKYNCPLFEKVFFTAEGAERNKTSIQVQARNERYQWFNELLAEMNQPAWLLTAHHLDDNIETVLMNFFKGTGIAGLRGILPRQKNIVRPLLFARKEEILQFAKENHLSWVEDSSNASDKYTRNYFRQQVIPLIEKIYPSAVENLADNLHRFSEIESIYADWTKSQIKDLVEQKGEEFQIPVRKLKKLPAAKTLLYEFIRQFGFSAAQADEAFALLDSDSGKYVLSSSHRILKNRNWLILSANREVDQKFILIESPDKEAEFSQGKLSVQQANGEFKERLNDISKDQSIAMLDAAKVEFPLLLRRWRPGDYFYPLGMQKKKKLARFFIDQKLSLAQKEKVWVIESNKKILWVVGMRIDDRVKLTGKTKNYLKITFASSR